MAFTDFLPQFLEENFYFTLKKILEKGEEFDSPGSSSNSSRSLLPSSLFNGEDRPEETSGAGQGAPDRNSYNL